MKTRSQKGNLIQAKSQDQDVPVIKDVKIYALMNLAGLKEKAKKLKLEVNLSESEMNIEPRRKSSRNSPFTKSEQTGKKIKAARKEVTKETTILKEKSKLEEERKEVNDVLGLELELKMIKDSGFQFVKAGSNMPDKKKDKSSLMEIRSHQDNGKDSNEAKRSQRSQIGDRAVESNNNLDEDERIHCDSSEDEEEMRLVLEDSD